MREFDVAEIEAPSQEEIQDIESLSKKEGLAEYIEPIDNAIKTLYSGVNSIEHALFGDPGTPGSKQICFEIHIASEPDDIIREQREFDRFIVRTIPSDKRRFFAFIYDVS